MEDFLTNLYLDSSTPFLSALFLGLLTAISPCPLAANITAIGFISKDVENRKRVFINGLIYTLGRAISYTTLAIVLFIGADELQVSSLFQKYGERFLGPLLVVIGLFMLDVLRIRFPGMDFLTRGFEKKKKHSYWDVMLLGFVFALAFCPYSGVLYFGMLIPLTLSSPAGLYLPVVFAIATGIPVILFAWLLAYTVSGVGTFYQRIKNFEIWFRRVVSVIFILVGLYYTWLVWIK